MPDSVSQQLADDATTHSINLLRIEAGMRLKVVKMLENLEGDLVGQLAGTDLTTAKKQHLETYLAQTKGQIADAYQQIAAIGSDELEKVATLTSKQTAKSIDAALTVNVGTVLSPVQLQAIARGPLIEGSPMESWWNGQSEAAQRKFTGAVQQGLLLGEDMAAIQRRIRGTKANGYKDGVLSVSKREAEALTRTAVQAVQNSARLETMKQHPDLVKGIAWLATLDGRTTKICMGLNGKEWTLPDYQPVGHDKAFPGPVAHWGCRSTQTPITYSWAELMAKKGGGKALGKPKLSFEEAFKKRLAEQGFSDGEIAEIKSHTKASMDGQVPEALTHDEWLARKGDEFAKAVLGPGRFALWKDGKLTVADLTDQHGRELTLAQLEAAIDAGGFPVETEGNTFPEAPIPASYKSAAEAQAKAKLAADQLAEAEAKLADYKAKTEGQTLKNKWAKKVDAELPDAGPVEKVAWVEAKAAEEQAAKSKAAALSMAKKKLVAGQPATPAQQAVIDALTEEEKANFDEAVADAKAKQSGVLVDALKEKLTFSNGKVLPGFEHELDALKKADPAAHAEVMAHAEQLEVAAFKAELDKTAGQYTEDQLHQLVALQKKNPAAAVDVAMHATGLQAEASAGLELEAMEKAPGGSFAVANAKALLKPDATNVAILAEAKHVLEEVATHKLIDYAANPAGQTLKHKALADALKMKPAELQSAGKSKVTDAILDQGKASELLTKVDTVAAEKQAAASAAAAISGAKKKWLEGKPFTAAQQAAWDSLTPEQQKSYLDAWDATKTTAPVAGGTTVQAPDVTATGPVNLDVQIPAPEGLVKLQDLSGSTRPYLAEDPGTGKKWVVKDSTRGGGGVDHFQSEALADALYRAAGVNVPASTVVLRDNGTRAVKVSEFIPNGKTLAQWKQGKSAAEVEAMHATIRQNFVADALFANWDVAGMGDDNIFVTADGVPVRIDNGGSLFFRAQGGSKKLPPEVLEMKTLRDASTNPNTAAIFRGLTQGEIDTQIAELVARRDVILAAADADPKVRDALAKRLDWLEQQLPPGAKKAAPPQAPATSAGQIPADIGKRLETGARGAGTSLLGDGDAIEDQQLKVWREVAPDGRRLLKVEADLTFAGSERILKTFEAAGLDVSTRAAKASRYGGISSLPPAKPSNTHPKDDYWPAIENAAKTVSVHAADGNYNASTMATFEAAKKKLNDAIDHDDLSDPQATAMLKHYAEAMEKVDNAKATSTALAKGDLTAYKTPAGWVLGGPAPATAAVTGDNAVLDGWQLARTEDFAFTVKEFKGGELHDTGVVNTAQGEEIRADYGRVFTMKKGPVEVTVLAFRDDAKQQQIRRSLQGTVRINVASTDDVAALESAFDALRKMGIDATAPTVEQRELLYLHRVVALRNDHESAGYKKALAHGGTDAERVEAVKDWAEKQYNVKLPRKEADWGDHYNPNGTLPRNGTGSRTWQRWDYTPAQIAKITDNSVLLHASSHVEEVFLAWLDNAGNATPTMGRVRQGVEIGYKGASPSADMHAGGGNFLYASHTTKANGLNTRGFSFYGRNLARTDIRSDLGDSYGEWSAADSRRGSLEQMANQTSVGISSNTGLMKNGINIFDELLQVKTGDATVRQRLIDAMKARGFKTWPDGRKLEDVIK